MSTQTPHLHEAVEMEGQHGFIEDGGEAFSHNATGHLQEGVGYTLHYEGTAVRQEEREKGANDGGLPCESNHSASLGPDPVVFVLEHMRPYLHP
jgi:hypothetical protein